MQEAEVFHVAANRIPVATLGIPDNLVNLSGKLFIFYSMILKYSNILRYQLASSPQMEFLLLTTNAKPSQIHPKESRSEKLVQAE